MAVGAVKERFNWIMIDIKSLWSSFKLDHYYFYCRSRNIVPDTERDYPLMVRRKKKLHLPFLIADQPKAEEEMK